MILLILTLSSYAETRKYYNSGELRFVFPTKVNGKLEGTVTEYYKNGNVKYKWNYHNGQKHNIAKKYENGSLKYTWYYNHGKRSITTKEYNRDGTLKQKLKQGHRKQHTHNLHHHKPHHKNMKCICYLYMD